MSGRRRTGAATCRAICSVAWTSFSLEPGRNISAASAACRPPQKLLKQLSGHADSHTGLKPGANEKGARQHWAIILVGAAWLLLTTFSALANPLESKGPKFILRLNLNEFSILNVSEMDGLLKYGGSGEFKLSMAREGTNEVVWTVTVENPRLMELLGIFVGEKTVKLVQSLDPNSIEPNQKLALQAVKSLTQKLEQAQKNPVWDVVTLSGFVMREKENWRIVSKDAVANITGNQMDELKKLEGKAVVASGFIKVKDQFEVTSFLEKRKNTLEVFVMSLCPFGQRAETSLFTHLESLSVVKRPSLEIHYLFYKRTTEGKDTFVALHGEPEIAENLGQMVIRDRFPQVFRNYLGLRATNATVPFAKLAVHAGLKESDVQDIEQTMMKEREALILKEYEYATGRYGISDGSPTYVWESERVADLRKVEAFKGMAGGASEACAQ